MADERDNQAQPSGGGSAPPANEAASGSGGASSTSQDGSGPRRKRKRRRRGKKNTDSGGGADKAANTPSSTGPKQSGDGAWQSLATGLFSHLDDRPIPCSVDGCPRTWFWSVQEQMQALGKPPPRRMCAEHEAERGNVADREIACANPGCDRTWTWNRGAQLKAMQRHSGTQPPSKVCPQCAAEERQLPDKEVTCRVDGCARTWTWTADAQLKHRVWARRYAEEQKRGEPHGGNKRDRKRRGRRRKPRPDIHAAPARMCGPCHDKLSRIQPAEGPCKVHGCSRMAEIDKESQLRAWARLGTEDLDARGTLPRRMCLTCRDFCRSHPDREVRCGRPGCEHTWTYKTGAQLQDFLAGRSQDPIRLCDDCNKGGTFGVDPAPDGMEAMPCVVPLCDGVWFYREGVTAVAHTRDPLPVDRMCDRCRGERGAAPRSEPPATEDNAQASSPDADVAKAGTEAAAADVGSEAAPSDTPVPVEGDDEGEAASSDTPVPVEGDDEGEAASSDTSAEGEGEAN